MPVNCPKSLSHIGYTGLMKASEPRISGITDWQMNRRIYILDSVLQWFYVAIGVWVLIWRQYLSFSQIGLIAGAGLFVSLLLELPSGALADMLGRKKTVIIGRVLNVAGFAVYAVATDFNTFLIANILYHAGWAFESGALSALLYDSLKENGQEERYFQKTETDTFFWCTIGMAAASILGGFLYRIDIHAPYTASFIVSLGALVGAFFFREPAVRSKPFSAAYYIRQNIEGVKHIFAHRLIRSISVFSVLIDFVAYAGLWYLYEPRLAAGGFNARSMGFLVAGTYLIRAVGTKLIPALIRKFNQADIPVFLTLIQMAGSALSYAGGGIGAIGSVYTRKFADGFRKPILSNLQNGQISSQYRATSLSAIALLSNLLIALVGPVIGWMNDSYGTPSTLGLFFWVGLILVLPFAMQLRHHIRISGSTGDRV